MKEENAIVVKDVSMHFNMASERVETLKEYFMKFLKHELFFHDFVAVDHVSFEVKKGEVFGIVGTNGSGKSTMLKMISGIMEPTEGTIQTNGVIAPLIELGAGFDGELTAYENIFLNGAVLGYDKEFIEEKFSSIVDFAELWDFLDMPIKNYSSGMVARIAFAIATVVKPDILIVDEILAVGDFLFQQKCEKRIKDLMEEGVTVVIVSHSIDQIESLCDRVLWLEKSKMKMIGNTFDVCNAYRDLQNQKEHQIEKEYQIAAHEKCSVCGKSVDFRNEPGMTYMTEAFCSHCGATVRVSDMMKVYLNHMKMGQNSSLSEQRKVFADMRIFETSNQGALPSFFSQFQNFTCMGGSFAERVRKLGQESFDDSLEREFDLMCVEELMICVPHAVSVLQKLAKHLRKDGVMLVTLQLYENEKSELDRKTKNKMFWNGAQIVNKWGENDIIDIFAKAGLQAELYQGHKWYESEDIIKFDTQYEKMMSTHPFYYYKFNTWIILATRLR